MKSLSLLIVILTLFSTSALADDSAEVEAARKAAKTHNEMIEGADEALAEAIAKAKESHTRRVIAAKDRMIEDLRRALRIAAQGKEPENSVIIGQQINRLKEQVEAIEANELYDLSDGANRRQKISADKGKEEYRTPKELVGYRR